VTVPPGSPKIYHIAHVDRLASIVSDGCLWCDAAMVRRPGSGTVIGMSSIKERRLGLPVHCHPQTSVGDYVPFYFCSRPIMLYVIYRANHPELAYRGGQGPIVHLEADLACVVSWANSANRRWAFTLSNAGARYTQFRSDLANLGDVNWSAVASWDFRTSDVNEGKQAEFLMYDSFPWPLISRVGVHSRLVGQQALQSIAGASHRPEVRIEPTWYY
jgi:ssDNA thymidine ADP-ribosyltransferase, DarT